MFSISRHGQFSLNLIHKGRANTQVEAITVAVVFSKVEQNGEKGGEGNDERERYLSICCFAIILLTHIKSLDKEERNGER